MAEEYKILFISTGKTEKEIEKTLKNFSSIYADIGVCACKR